MNKQEFIETVTTGYNFNGASIIVGTAMLAKEAIPNVHVKIPLPTISRHGLIAGATGTGKTKTLQYLSEQLSKNGVSVLMMDIKGDVSGIAKPGNDNPKLIERHKLIGIEWKSAAFPVELLTISSEKGVKLRATVSEFGPVLLSKMLELNDNQQGVISIAFKYCDDKKLPLLDIKDLRKVLQHISEEGKEEVKQYGNISSQTVGVILRKLVELETQGAEHFFGELSFEVDDLLRKDGNGKGYINVLRLCDIQSTPKLFSTFMLCLLAEIYQKFPEVGDKETPKLAIFIDEAHLIFRESSKSLLEQIETIIKLIRSKGVGIYFCTQSPDDIPESVLGQLGLKIQHSLRAFTAKDRKGIKLAAQNYPLTKYYNVEALLTELGIGESLITALGENGVPTPLVHTLMCAPSSRMDVLTPQEQDEIIAKSEIAKHYNKTIDRESAFEMLTNKLSNVQTIELPADKQIKQNTIASSKEKSVLEHVTGSPLMKTVVKEVTHGLFGMLFGNTSSNKKRKSLFN